MENVSYPKEGGEKTLLVVWGSDGVKKKEIITGCKKRLLTPNCLASDMDQEEPTFIIILSRVFNAVN